MRAIYRPFQFRASVSASNALGRDAAVWHIIQHVLACAADPVNLPLRRNAGAHGNAFPVPSHPNQNPDASLVVMVPPLTSGTRDDPPKGVFSEGEKEEEGARLRMSLAV